MRVEWFGQSAFSLQAGETTVMIDPFDDLSGLKSRGIVFEYPSIEVTAQLLLITHEHADHNGVGAVKGDPVILRSTAGRLQSPIGEIVAVASEHDDQAGTARGPNTIFVFELDELRVCHFGDFGQQALREEQATAIGDVDLLIVPVGGGPTLDAAGAGEVVRRLKPHWVVPMHYRTPRIGFLETADAFLEGFEQVHRTAQSFQTSELPRGEAPIAVVPEAP